MLDLVQSRLARNTVWMSLGQGLRLVLQAAYFVVIARSLGAANYGAFIGVVALVGILYPFAALGSGSLLIKNVARYPSLFSLNWGRALTTTALCSSALLFLVLLVSHFLLPGTIPLRLVVLVAGSDLFGLSLIVLCGQAFQAFEQLNWTATIQVMASASKITGALVLIAIHPHPNALQWGYLYCCSTWLAALMALFLVLRKLGKPQFNLRRSAAELREGMYFSASLSAQTIYNDIDKTMLVRLGTLEAAGIYGAAYRLTDVAFVPIQSLLAAAYPNFFRSGMAGLSGTLAYARRLLRWAVVYAVCACLALILCAGIVPRLLGPEYANTVEALRWLALLPVLKVLHYFMSDSLTGAGYQGLRTAIQAAVAVFNVLINLWIIPAYSWRGAAWSSIASDALLACGVGTAAWMLSRLANRRSAIGTEIRLQSAEETRVATLRKGKTIRLLIFPSAMRGGDNPYGDLLYRDMAGLGVQVEDFSFWRVLGRKYDLFHLHWPEYYLNLSPQKALLGAFAVLGANAWLRMRGTRIVWTIHNLRSHAQAYPRLERWFWKVFTRLLDGYVSMSHSCCEWVEDNLPALHQVESAEIPHGHYRSAYASPIGTVDARRALGLHAERTVLLFFGGVSPYKNVPHLIGTFRDADLAEATLLVAGRPDTDKYRQKVIAAAGDDPGVRLDLRSIPREEVPLLFAAADLVVLPFKDIMHSGSAMLALSCNRPVLVPARGALPELQDRVGTEWVRTYSGELTSTILRDAVRWAREVHRASRPDLSSFEWTPIVEATVGLYSRLCTPPSPSATHAQSAGVGHEAHISKPSSPFRATGLPVDSGP